MTAARLALTLEPAPGAELATELLRGEAFTVYEHRADGLAWGQAETDGYVGYVAAAGLGADRPDGRRVTALSGHVYAAPSVKARTVDVLPFWADVAVLGEEAGFAALAGGGYAPLAQLAPPEGDAAGDAAGDTAGDTAGDGAGDAAAVALRFLSAPYLWGGRSAAGIDCSGLVQLAHLATGVPAPRDSDMQAALMGAALEAEAPLWRGDLVFWRGHVGILLDPDTLLHANAHHMAVAVEPLAEAVARIAAAGGGPVTARRRPAAGRPG